MLVQMSIEETMSKNSEYSGVLFCQRCNGEVGPVTKQELKFLLYENAEDVLCFKCEEISPAETRDFSDREKLNLLRFFQIESLLQVPTFGAFCWENKGLNVHMQLEPTHGWCLWYPMPDGKLTLHNVRMSLRKVTELRDSMNLRPVQRKDKPLVL